MPVLAPKVMSHFLKQLPEPPECNGAMKSDVGIEPRYLDRHQKSYNTYK